MTDAQREANRRMFKADGPAITPHGPEPSLEHVLEHYYRAHGCDNSEELAQRYIDAWETQ